MEPRAAVAEWQDGRLTVWTGTSNPFSVRQQVAEALRVPPERVRVIVPHFGGGFGGKHTGEAAVEAARLAKEAGRPVALQWTRAEEFMWAYFRPAALIEVEAGLDAAQLDRGLGLHQLQLGRGGSGHSVPHRQHAGEVRRHPIRRSGRAPTAAWRPRRTTSRGRRSPTNWPKRRARIRWSSGSRTWITRGSGTS